jgi:hypothetical protein
MAVFVEPDAILAYVGIKLPTDAETAWATACANAVNDGISVRLNGALILDPYPAELTTAALMAGGEAFKRREAPFGITGFNDMEGNAIRLARDYLDGVRPVIDRYGAGPGIG